MDKVLHFCQYFFALDIFVFQKLNKITQKKPTLQQINNMRNEYLKAETQQHKLTPCSSFPPSNFGT